MDEIESDEEDRKSDYVFEENAQTERKQTIIVPETPTGHYKRTLSNKKSPIRSPEFADRILEENSYIRGSVGEKLVVNEGFDFHSSRNFSEEIATIEGLIRGNCNKRGRTLEERKPGYKITKSGGVECCNPDEIKSQEGIVTELLKTAGKTLMEGKNVVGSVVASENFRAKIFNREDV